MDIFFSFLGIAAALAGAPLLPGIINKVKAFYAGRKGPSVFQQYYDIAKLMQKECVYSRTTGVLFRVAPTISLLCCLMALLLLPVASQVAFLGFYGDPVLFLYLFGLGRMFTVLGAMDTGSSFEGMGASRECQFALLTEGVFLAIFGAMVMMSRDFSLAGALHSMKWSSNSVSCAAAILLMIALFIVILMENCRVPMDDPDTHLELTMIHEAMILDNSGPDLAIIFYGASLKLWVLLLFEVMLLMPSLPAPLAFTVEIAGVLLGAVVVGVVESVTARYRFKKVPQILGGALAIAVVAIALLLLFPAGGVR